MDTWTNNWKRDGDGTWHGFLDDVFKGTFYCKNVFEEPICLGQKGLLFKAPFVWIQLVANASLDLQWNLTDDKWLLDMNSFGSSTMETNELSLFDALQLE